MELTEAQAYDIGTRTAGVEARAREATHETRAGMILLYLELRGEATPQEKSHLTRLINKWDKELPSA